MTDGLIKARDTGAEMMDLVTQSPNEVGSVSLTYLTNRDGDNQYLD